MKSERSQVQESNLLADKIEQRMGQLRPYLPVILGTIVAVILLMLGYGVYSSQREVRASRAWTDFYFSDTQSQDLEAISQDYSDTSAGLVARLTAGDANMAKAMEKWNVDRNLADQFFGQAADDYRQVLEKASDSFLKSRAQLGLAQALEGLGKRLDAVDEYRRIAGMKDLSSEFIAEANKRIEWLESRNGETFYQWYADRRPTAPTEGLPGSVPGLPSMPDLSFPNLPASETSGGTP